MCESNSPQDGNTIDASLMYLVMRFQGWIKDMNANVDRRSGFEAQMLTPSQKMSPTLRALIARAFDYIEQTERPLAIAEHIAKSIRHMACTQLTPSEIITFFLERRSGRYSTVLFENDLGGQRVGAGAIRPQ